MMEITVISRTSMNRQKFQRFHPNLIKTPTWQHLQSNSRAVAALIIKIRLQFYHLHLHHHHHLSAIYTCGNESDRPSNINSSLSTKRSWPKKQSRTNIPSWNYMEIGKLTIYIYGMLCKCLFLRILKPYITAYLFRSSIAKLCWCKHTNWRIFEILQWGRY